MNHAKRRRLRGTGSFGGECDIMETMRYLRVIETATGEVVKELDVTQRHAQFIEHAKRSLLKSMDKEHYHVADVSETPSP